MVVDFGAKEKPWRNIDDVVMGGVSRSQFTVKDGVGIFEGNVSLENNGGFASARSEPRDVDLRGYTGLILRVRGDGKRYGLRLRTRADFDGVSYQAPLPTKAGEWQEVRIPFADFKPVFRGQVVRGAPALDLENIKTFGFIISDKQEGPFKLEVKWVKAYAPVSQKDTASDAAPKTD
ncbi:MAG TPA: CIA30 family protein [Candidatus Hydrogenedentes bacterium]|nr:CIA30 family protein [Candidatus Hydrogenedentota bacterium]